MSKEHKEYWDYFKNNVTLGTPKISQEFLFLVSKSLRLVPVGNLEH